MFIFDVTVRALMLSVKLLMGAVMLSVKLQMLLIVLLIEPLMRALMSFLVGIVIAVAIVMALMPALMLLIHPVVVPLMLLVDAVMDGIMLLVKPVMHIVMRSLQIRMRLGMLVLIVGISRLYTAYTQQESACSHKGGPAEYVIFHGLFLLRFGVSGAERGAEVTSSRTYNLLVFLRGVVASS